MIYLVNAPHQTTYFLLVILLTLSTIPVMKNFKAKHFMIFTADFHMDQFKHQFQEQHMATFKKIVCIENVEFLFVCDFFQIE